MSVALSAATYGAGGTPLVLLHGLFGSGRNWASIAQRLAAGRRALAADLRNHGASPWAQTMGYDEMAEDVAALLRASGVDRAAVLGHSMGGKVAMMLALTRPELVERLIVVDIAPVAYPPALLGHVEAMQAVPLDQITRRGQADAALAAAVTSPAERAFLLQNLVLEAGKARWRLNLPALARNMPQICGFPAGTRRYAGPALFINGERSSYVAASQHDAIRALFPRAGFVTIAGAGHWVHAEQPEAFLAALSGFLDAAP